MRIIAWTGLLALTLTGCGAKNGEAARSPAEREQAAARKEVRQAVDRLRDDVIELRRSPALEQDDLVAAVRSSAAALNALPESDTVRERISNMETYADQIAQSEPRARQQAGWARGALMEGAATLEQVAATRGRDDMDPWIRAIRARADAIQLDVSVLEQRDTIVEAFNDLTEATAYLGMQRPEPQG